MNKRRVVPKILLVVDDRDSFRLLYEVLEEAGYFVLEASTAAEGLGLLAAGYQPELIVLDLLLPKMGGRQLLDVCSRTPWLASVPVIVLSTFSPLRSEPGSREIFFRKPFHPAELVDEVGRLLRAHSTSVRRLGGHAGPG